MKKHRRSVLEEQHQAVEVGSDANDADDEDQKVASVTQLLALEGQAFGDGIDFGETLGKGFV
jgi:hypothetical protein